MYNCLYSISLIEIFGYFTSLPIAEDGRVKLEPSNARWNGINKKFTFKCSEIISTLLASTDEYVCYAMPKQGHVAYEIRLRQNCSLKDLLKQNAFCAQVSCIRREIYSCTARHH